MPIQTEHYLLEAFLDGDAYLAIADRRRFSTIDNQMYRIAEIVGDGIIEGWNIEEGDFPSITVTSGSGLINGFYVNTFDDQEFELSANGTFHIFAQRRSGIVGTVGPKSDVVSISYTDAGPPATPTNLSIAAPEAELVTLDWSAVSDVDLDHYEIDRKLASDSLYVLLDSTDSTYYEDTTVDEETSYDYRVYAVDQSGYRSTAPASDSITTPVSTVLPPNPVDVLTPPSEAAINILWKRPPSVDFSKIKHWKLTLAELDTDDEIIAGSEIERIVNKDLYNDRFDDLVNGQNYLITLQTVDTKNRESVGFSRRVSPQPSQAPRDPEGIAYSSVPYLSGLSVSLSWTDGDTPYDPATTYRYNIYVTVDGRTESSRITVPIGDTSEIITAWTPDTNSGQYEIIPEQTILTFRITALDQSGFESFGSYIRFKSERFSEHVGVQNLGAAFNSSNNSILVNWINPSGTSNVRVVVLRDDLESAYIYNQEITNEILGGPGDRYLIADVGLNFNYTIQVTSIDQDGIESPTSAVSVPIGGLPLPDPPDQMQIQVGDRQLRLSWDPSTSLYTSSYRLYRKTGDVTFEPNDYALLDSINVGVTNFTDYGLENNQLYAYYVTSVDVYGRESLHLTDGAINLNFIAEAPKQEGGLTQPDNVEASVVGSNVVLTWESLSEEFDSFTIYRSINNLHTWELIANVDRNTTTFTDISLPLIDGTVFHYVIDKTINDSDISVQTSSLAPESSLLLGVVTTSDSEFTIDITDRRDIADMADPLAEYTNQYLLPHRHRDIETFDPDRIDLNPELIVTDWSTVDGRIWTTQEDITGNTYLLKINDRFPSVFFEVDATFRRIIFSEPIVTVDAATGSIIGDIPVIELRVIGVEEVQGVLESFRFNNIHARQIQFGTINKEQIISVNHEGRIKETLFPKRYLLERFSNHTFVVPQANTDTTKMFGDGTTFYTITAGDGQIKEVVDFDLFNDRSIVAFWRPSYATDTITNLKQDQISSSVSSSNNIANRYIFKPEFIYGFQVDSNELNIFDPNSPTTTEETIGTITVNTGWTAFDDTHGIAYHLGRRTGILMTFDPAKGSSISEIQLNLDSALWNYRGFEVINGLLYLVASDDSTDTNFGLYRINPSTGETTEIGSPITTLNVSGMFYNYDSDTVYLYGTTIPGGSLSWGTLDISNNTYTPTASPSAAVVWPALTDAVYINNHPSLADNFYFMWDTATKHDLYRLTTTGTTTLVSTNAPDAHTLAYSHSETMWLTGGSNNLINLGDFKGLRSDTYLKIPVNVPVGSAVSKSEIVFTASTSVDFIRVDNRDSSFTVLSGSWSSGSAVLPSGKLDLSESGDGRKYYRFTDSTGTGVSDAAAEWRPTIVQAGYYQVATRFYQSANRTNSVPFTINHANGSTTVRVNQEIDVNHLIWVELGRFYFNEGSEGSVVIGNGSFDGGAVIADEILFYPINSSPGSGDDVRLNLSYLDPTGLSDAVDFTSESLTAVSTVGSVVWQPDTWSNGEQNESTSVDITSFIRDFTTRDDYYTGKHIFIKIETLDSSSSGHYRTAVGYGPDAPLIRTNFTRDLAEVNSNPGGFQSSKSYHFNFEFADDNATRWVRIRSLDAPNKPNPILDLSKRLRFKILLRGASTYLTLGIREITQPGNIGGNGGTIGPIEWVGAKTVASDSFGNIAPIGILIEPSDDWQEIDIDLSRQPVISFDSGNSILSKGLGVWEHIAFTVNPDDESPTGPFDIYIDKIEQVSDLLVAGTSQGILLSRDLGVNWETSRLTDTPVHKFYKARNNFIWAISASEVLIAVDPAYWFVMSGTTGIQYVRDIAEDTDGNIYISTDRGVYFFEIALLKNFTTFRQTSPVTAFTTDCYGLHSYSPSSGLNEIWVSTEIGIFKTDDQGLTWTDSGMDTSGLSAYQFIDIGSQVILANTRKHILRKMPGDATFSVIANFEEQFGIFDIWKMEYFSGRLYVSTGNGVYVNDFDGLTNPTIHDIGFVKVFPEMEINGVTSVAFGLNAVQMDPDDKLFIGQENRLLSASPNHVVSIRREFRNKELPSFFVDDEEVNIGYIYNAFNNVLVFREPQSVISVVSAANIPRRVYLAKEGGWAHTNAEADVFIYKNGFPAWLDFALDESAILGEMQLIRDRLNAMPTLTTFNSLYPKSQELLNSTLATIELIISGGDNESPLINSGTIITFLENYTRFVSVLSSELIRSSNLQDAEIKSIGFRKSDREPGSRAAVLEQAEDFEAENSTGIVIDTASGEVDFLQAYSAATSPEDRDALSFDKYEDMKITIFNANVSNVGEFTHREIEDRMEDINTGLPSHLSRATYTNLIKLGIYVESKHNYVFDAYNASNIQSKFYAAHTNEWYDMLNSTLDYNSIISVSNHPEPRFTNTSYWFTEDPYFAGNLWIGTDKDIIQYSLDQNNELYVSDVIRPGNGSRPMFVWDIYAHKENEVYVVAEDSESQEGRIYLTVNFGLTWQQLDTINLPRRIYRFKILNGNKVAGTQSGVFYSDNDFGTWYALDVVPSSGLSGNTQVIESFGKAIRNIALNRFIIIESNRWFYTSGSGLDAFAVGRATSNSISVVNKVLRFKNMTWIATDRGLHTDNNSILSDNVTFEPEDIENSLSDSISVAINDVIAGSESVYCCGTNGKIYRYLDENTDDSIGNEWKSYLVPDFGPIHRIILNEVDTSTYLVVVSYNKLKLLDVTVGSGVFG